MINSDITYYLIVREDYKYRPGDIQSPAAVNSNPIIERRRFVEDLLFLVLFVCSNSHRRTIWDDNVTGMDVEHIYVI